MSGHSKYCICFHSSLTVYSSTPWSICTKYPVALLQIRLMMHFYTGTIELLMGEDPLLQYPYDSFMKVCNDGELSGMMDDVKPWLRCLTSHLSQEQLSCLSPKEGDSFSSWCWGDWTWTLPEPQNMLWKDEPASSLLHSYFNGFVITRTFLSPAKNG